MNHPMAKQQNHHQQQIRTQNASAASTRFISGNALGIKGAAEKFGVFRTSCHQSHWKTTIGTATENQGRAEQESSDSKQPPSSTATVYRNQDTNPINDIIRQLPTTAAAPLGR